MYRGRWWRFGFVSSFITIVVNSLLVVKVVANSVQRFLRLRYVTEDWRTVAKQTHAR